MRSTLMLLVLVCGPAFSQENAKPTPESAAQRLNDNLQQRLADILDPQKIQTPQKMPAAGILRGIPKLMAAKPASSICSIPLLNVKPPGTPVAMPNMMPKTAVPGNNPWQTNLTDNMKIVAPAPACPADFGKVSVPRTAP